MKRLELATTLDRTGEKRITLLYDDISNELFIQEGELVKPIVDTQLFNLMINKSIDQLKNEMKFCCKGCSRYFVVWYNGRVKKKKAPYTRYEHFMKYYWLCLNNNFGQGERKMFTDYDGKPYPIYTYEYVEAFINKMNKKYKDLGYEL